MADLSSLSDEQLDAYKGLIQQKQAPAQGPQAQLARPGENAPEVQKPPLPFSLRRTEDILPKDTPVKGGPILPSAAMIPTIVGEGASKVASHFGASPLVSAGAGLLAGGAAGAPTLARAIPSAERAGANFESVMQRVGSRPINTEHIAPIVGRARELEQAGGTMPKVASDLEERMALPKTGASGGFKPITYKEGRDFASNAGKLSVAERASLQGPMGGQVKLLAKALGDANREVAENAGMGKEYDSAMTEYRRAMQMKQAGTELAKAGKVALKRGIPLGLAGGAAGGAGYYAAKALGFGESR